MSWFESLANMVVPRAVGHFAAGIALALADRVFSRTRSTSHSARMSRRLDALRILTYLRELEAGGAGAAPPMRPEQISESDVGEPPSAEEIREACVYLREELAAGNLRVDCGPAPYTHETTGAGESHDVDEPDAPGLRERADSAWNGFVDWLHHEKINPHRALTKLKIGYGIEIAADLVQGLSQLVWGRGNFFSALAHSIYQGAALAFGLMVGGLLFKRRDDRAPRRVRKQVERLEEEIGRDPGALDLLERIAAGETPRLATPPLPAGDGATHRHHGDRDDR